MNPSLATFAKRMLVVSISAGIVSLALYFILPHNWFSPSLPWLFVFYYACGIISFRILQQSLQKRFNRFVGVFMLTTALKLFLFIAIMIIYSFLNKNDAVAFLLNFFVLYLVYTVFEVTEILRLARPPASE